MIESVNKYPISQLFDIEAGVIYEIPKYQREYSWSKQHIKIVKSRIGPQAMTSMHIHFGDYDSTRVIVIRCKKSPIPVFVKDGETERFYVRTGPFTTELPASQTQEYIRRRFRL